MKKPGTVKVTRSGEIPKMVSLNQRLLNITDQKELQKALSKLTDKQYQQYKADRQKSAGIAFINSSFHYISRWHRAYLWMFPMHVSVDCDGEYHTEIRYKVAFGNYFVLHEYTKKHEDK